MRGLATGARCVPRAVSLLRQSGRLRLLSLGPLLVSLVVLGALVALSFMYGDDLLNRFWRLPGAGDSRWLGVAHGLAQALVLVLLLIVSGAVFFFGSVLAAEPFIDALSEHTEGLLGATPGGRPGGLRGVVRELWWVVRDVLLDLSLFALLQLLVALLSLIPVFGPPLHLLLGWLLSAYFAALEMVNGPLIRRGWHGRSRWRVARANQGALLGLGAVVTLLLLVPLAQLCTLPIAVIAGTVLVVELDRAGKLVLGPVEGGAADG